MKIIRFLNEDKEYYGVLKNDVINIIEGDIFGTYSVCEKNVKLSDVKVLPPCKPSKIVCVGLNYVDHQAEMKDYAESFPKLFFKPTTAIIAHNENIITPEGVDRVEYEAELAIVISKTAKNIPAGKSKDYILGYTCLNDVTARALQAIDVQWTRAKSFDTFAPFGPVIETEMDPDNADIKLLLNGEAKQSSNTKNLIWNTAFLVEEISKIMTLLPGDVISTGTPSGCGKIEVGDKVEVVIENIGTLTNYLV